MATDGIRGSLIGLAAGDCLGAPVEGRAPSAIRATFGVLRDFLYEAPIWTDDTQQAFVLVESGVRFGTLAPDWIGERFVEMSHPRGPRRFGCHRGTGRGFRAAVCAFEGTRDWRTSGQPDRAGNGAAMRIGPSAASLAGLGDPLLAKAVTDASLVTHRESRAIAGALAVAWIVTRMVQEPAFPLPPVRARQLIGDLGPWLQEREAWLAAEYPQVAPYQGDRHDLSALFRELAARWDDGWPACEQAIVECARRRLGEATWATAGYVLCSVPTAICLTLSARDALEEAMIRAVNLGGDADTVGAMVGTMAGAAGGLAAIPLRWRRFAGYKELLAWGDALAGRTAGRDYPHPDALPDRIALERRLWATRRGG